MIRLFESTGHDPCLIVSRNGNEQHGSMQRKQLE
jgi:hypothetical protein